MKAIVFYCIDNFGKQYKFAKVCKADKVAECIENLESTEVVDHEVIDAYEYE